MFYNSSYLESLTGSKFQVGLQNHSFYCVDSFIIPNDGSADQPKESTISIDSGNGRLLLALEVIGLIFSVGSIILVVVFRANPVIKRASPPFLVTMIFGSASAYASNSFFIGRPTSADCNVQTYLHLLSFILVFGSMIVKNFRVYWLFTGQKLQRMYLLHDGSLMLYLFAMVAIEVVSVRKLAFTLLEAIINKISDFARFVHHADATSSCLHC
jgi:hypothetical protein